jgi:serine/threonine protein kinase
MALAPGARLGPYEILSPLGAGGMGEVYRAHDSKLKRDVAIKILPQQVTNFPENGLFLEEPTMTPDGRYLVYSRSNGGSSLWVLQLGNIQERVR